MKPGEHKTVQTSILKYVDEIGWTFVSRQEAEQRRGFTPEVDPKDRAKGASLFFDDLLDTKVCEFNSRYAEAEGLLLGKFFDHEENRELDLDQDLWDYVIVHELLHFFVPNHGKL